MVQKKGGATLRLRGMDRSHPYFIWDVRENVEERKKVISGLKL